MAIISSIILIPYFFDFGGHVKQSSYSGVVEAFATVAFGKVSQYDLQPQFFILSELFKKDIGGLQIPMCHW